MTKRKPAKQQPVTRWAVVNRDGTFVFSQLNNTRAAARRLAHHASRVTLLQRGIWRVVRLSVPR